MFREEVQKETSDVKWTKERWVALSPGILFRKLRFLQSFKNFSITLSTQTSNQIKLSKKY